MNSTNQQGSQFSLASSNLENMISEAIKKVGGTKENDLCKYIPVDTGGYIHHFTLRKMKSESPEELSQMIQEFIITVKSPVTVAPKPRAPRGSRKQKGQVVFTKNEIEKMISIAKEMGYQDIVQKLTPKKPLTTCKKELINSIKQNKIDTELWGVYVEAVTVYNDANADLQANIEQITSNSSSPTLETISSMTSALSGNR
jgi:hypothetical protein